MTWGGVARRVSRLTPLGFDRKSVAPFRPSPRPSGLGHAGLLPQTPLGHMIPDRQIRHAFLNAGPTAHAVGLGRRTRRGQ